MRSKDLATRVAHRHAGGHEGLVLDGVRPELGLDVGRQRPSLGRVAMRNLVDDDQLAAGEGRAPTLGGGRKGDDGQEQEHEKAPSCAGVDVGHGGGSPGVKVLLHLRRCAVRRKASRFSER